jgi:hypothetical protein
VRERAAGKPCPWCDATGGYVPGAELTSDVKSIIRYFVRPDRFLEPPVYSAKCAKCAGYVTFCPYCDAPARDMGQRVTCASCKKRFA